MSFLGLYTEDHNKLARTLWVLAYWRTPSLSPSILYMTELTWGFIYCYWFHGVKLVAASVLPVFAWVVSKRPLNHVLVGEDDARAGNCMGPSETITLRS